jgi:hypothetical protein
MAELAKSGTPTPSTVGPDAGERIGTYYADVAIKGGDACRLTSNTTCALSSGAAANASADIHGWAGHDAEIGEPVTLWKDINFGYGAKTDAAFTPPAKFYLSATVPGGLSTTATTGGVKPAAVAVGNGRIHVKQVLN